MLYRRIYIIYVYLFGGAAAGAEMGYSWANLCYGIGLLVLLPCQSIMNLCDSTGLAGNAADGESIVAAVIVGWVNVASIAEVETISVVNARVRGG